MNLTKLLSLFVAFSALTTEAHSNENSSKNTIVVEKADNCATDADFQTQDEYTFDTKFDLKIEAFGKKGKLKQANEMTMMVSDDSENMAMIVNQEGINAEMIFDMKSKNIVTLMNTGGQKMATSTSLDQGQYQKMMEDNENSNADKEGKMPTFKKTGNTKTISGYSCDEYKVEHSEIENGSEVTYWITDEADFDWVKSLSNMSGMNKQMPDMSFGAGYPEDGSIIQMVVTEKNGEYTLMTITDIEQDKDITISTKGYTFMNMGNMGGR